MLALVDASMVEPLPVRGQHRLMVAVCSIEIGRHLIPPLREHYLPELAALFTESELLDQGERYGYVSRVCQIRDRLRLHGFTVRRTLDELELAVRTWHASDPSRFYNNVVPMLDASALLDELSSYVNSSNRWAVYHEPEQVFQQLDARTILCLALDLTEDKQSPVHYNLDALVYERSLTRQRHITEEAREARQERLARDAPLVVLTEGSSDSRILTEAVSVTHPHLIDFLRFMDFSGDAEGSVDSLVKLVRSFIGAGIANRVVAIADNDTKAYDAMEKLKENGVPDSYRIRHYPDLPLLTSYPTLGPQSDQPVLMDINGKAGSLEMYLGQELLALNSELVPVQWKGYIEGRRSYQGSIAKREKIRIQKAFPEKVRRAHRDPGVRHQQDWSGVVAIVETILGAFD